jgi:hypothetical protein
MLAENRGPLYEVIARSVIVVPFQTLVIEMLQAPPMDESSDQSETVLTEKESLVSGLAKVAVSGKGPDSEAENDQALPNELLLSIMEQLAVSRRQKTLLQLMLANRTCHELGLPLILRRLVVNSFTKPDVFTDPAKARHVRELEILFIHHDDVMKRLLESVVPHIESISFYSSDSTTTSLVWRALKKYGSPALKRVDADLMRDAVQFFTQPRDLPASVRYFGLYMDAFARPGPILQMLDQRAPGLKEWELRSEYITELKKCPSLMGKLRHAMTSNFMNGVSKIVTEDRLKLRSLEISFQSIRAVDMTKISAIAVLEELILTNVETSGLLLIRAFPVGLKRLVLRGPLFTAQVRNCVDALRVHDNLLSLKEIVVETTRWRAESAGAREEVEFWKSLPSVTWILLD